MGVQLYLVRAAGLGVLGLVLMVVSPVVAVGRMVLHPVLTWLSQPLALMRPGAHAAVCCAATVRLVFLLASMW